MGTFTVYHTIVNRSIHIGQTSERQSAEGLEVRAPLS